MTIEIEVDELRYALRGMKQSAFVQLERVTQGVLEGIVKKHHENCAREIAEFFQRITVKAAMAPASHNTEDDPNTLPVIKLTITIPDNAAGLLDPKP